MKSLKPFFLLLVLSFVLCSSMKCKNMLPNPEPKLPAETQTGAKTFGCFVDGQLYVPKGGPAPWRHAISASVTNNYLNINTDNGGDGINLSAKFDNNIGEYDLTAPNNRANYYIGNNNYSRTLGTITITKCDFINRIISGKFFFSAKEITTGKMVNITEGRFDVRYY